MAKIKVDGDQLNYGSRKNLSLEEARNQRRPSRFYREHPGKGSWIAHDAL